MWAWAVLGLAGSVLIACCAPRALHDGVVGWWYAPTWPGRAATTLIYAGMAGLAVAWAVLGRRLPSRRTLLLVSALWILPLALAPPLFSRDLYSYLAQGTTCTSGAILLCCAHRAGRPRYAHAPAAVSPFGVTPGALRPLFLELMSLIVGVGGSHLVAEVC